VRRIIPVQDAKNRASVQGNELVYSCVVLDDAKSKIGPESCENRTEASVEVSMGDNYSMIFMGEFLGIIHKIF
jgi:hypothetical protein